jgi:hypothetical protein
VDPCVKGSLGLSLPLPVADFALTQKWLGGKQHRSLWKIEWTLRLSGNSHGGVVEFYGVFLYGSNISKN